MALPDSCSHPHLVGKILVVVVVFSFVNVQFIFFENICSW